MSITDLDVTAVASRILGEPASVGEWRAEPIAYESGSPATGGLHRLGGTLADGRSFTAFVKLVQHARHWPRLHLLPPQLREGFAAQFPWRQELEAWQPGFAGRLPAGLRVPDLYRIGDLGDDRLLVFMEYIDAGPESSWDAGLFTRAATALGGLAALRGTPEALAACEWSPGWGLRGYVNGRVRQGALPLLDNDDVWRHPLIDGVVDADLRADLRHVAAAIPDVLDGLDRLPQAIPHGDASPQNLLVPRTDGGVLVAIDISFQGPHAVGFDLGQLLIGLAHAGSLDAAALPAIHDALVPAFLAGHKEYGGQATEDEIRYGYLGSLVVRAGFTSLPFELLGAPLTDRLREVFRARAALTRFLVDLGLSIL